MLKSIKNFARTISTAWLWKVLSVLKVLLLVRDAKGLKSIKFIKNKNQAIVLGNGPSLKNDIEKIAEVADDYDFICVNNFANSPYYTKFKPVTYVFLDGYFFSKDAHPDWIKQREKTFTRLNNDTTWKMNILLPYTAERGVVEGYLDNENIVVEYVKCSGIYRSCYSKHLDLLLNSGFFGPEQINVLIYAIYYGLWAGYDELNIFGADLSFHLDVEVDQKENYLYMTFRHFNSPDEKQILRRGPLKNSYETMFYMLDGQARTFKAHEILNSFAEHRGCLIKNKSSFSLIDAYTRS